MAMTILVLLIALANSLAVVWSAAVLPPLSRLKQRREFQQRRNVLWNETYCHLSATAGSTRSARQAGIAAAANVTSTVNAVAAA